MLEFSVFSKFSFSFIRVLSLLPSFVSSPEIFAFSYSAFFISLSYSSILLWRLVLFTFASTLSIFSFIVIFCVEFTFTWFSTKASSIFLFISSILFTISCSFCVDTFATTSFLETFSLFSFIFWIFCPFSTVRTSSDLSIIPSTCSTSESFPYIYHKLLWRFYYECYKFRYSIY